MLRVRVWTGSGPCCPRLWWGRGRGDACLVAPVAKDPWVAWAVRGTCWAGAGGTQPLTTVDVGRQKAEDYSGAGAGWPRPGMWTWEAVDVGGREHRWD